MEVKYFRGVGQIVRNGFPVRTFKWSDNWVTYNQKSAHDRKSIDAEAKVPGY